MVGLECLVVALPKPNYCDTDFGLQSFRPAGDESFAIENMRQILDSAATTKLLQLPETVGLQSFQNSGLEKLHYCELAKDFGLRDDNRTIANPRKILSCVFYQANKPPQVRYCAASDKFAMKRRFRLQEFSWLQRLIQPTRGPKTNDSAISPNAAWSAWNA